MTGWLETAGALSPLLAHAQRDGRGGEAGVLRELFAALPAGPGFLLTIGARAEADHALAALAAQRQWRTLHLGRRPAAAVAVATATAATTVSPDVLPATAANPLVAHGVPASPDCLAIGAGRDDYWLWRDLPTTCTPALVVVDFNAGVPAGVAAVVAAGGAPREVAEFEPGASLRALCLLAGDKGYRLIHIHGPRRLYFLRQDIELPPALCVRQPLTDADLALLTDTRAFETALECAESDRARDRPAPDVSQAPWLILTRATPQRAITVAGIPLQVLADKNDAQWYLQRKAHEERHSLLYPLLGQSGFDRFVDIGANVGYVSLIAALTVPGMRVLAIEADPRLAVLIRSNFGANLGEARSAVQVVNAIVGDRDEPSATFSLNPSGTLDNRVSMPKWEQVCVPMWTMDTLLARTGMAPDAAGAGRTFFKIDTQGFELRVLRGLESTLASRGDWQLKMEFAPDWLRSQGTDPETVLDHLQQRYEFAEFPERIPFGTSDLDTLFGAPVRPRDHRRFIEHVCSLNANGLGWVDLIVRPRPR